MAMALRDMKTLVLASLIFLAAPGLALGAPSVDAATAGVSPGRIDGATAQALVASGARVVEVRTAAEFSSGHVPGAINIPFDELPRRAGEIGPPTTPMVLYCRSGNRSGQAVDALRRAGYTKLYDMQRVTAWPGALAR